MHNWTPQGMKSLTSVYWRMTNPGSQSRRNAYNTQKMWFIEEFPYRWMYSQDCTQRNTNVFLKRQLIMIVINNNFSEYIS